MTPFQSILVTVLLLTGSTKLVSAGVDDGDTEEIPSKNGVLILTEKTFAEVIQANEYVLVMFSGTKCGHCVRLTPTYEEAAAALATEQPEVKVAKIDVWAERSVLVEYGIKGVPDVRLFRGGKPVAKYQGQRTKEAIVEWVKGKVAEGGAEA